MPSPHVPDARSVPRAALARRLLSIGSVAFSLLGFVVVAAWVRGGVVYDRFEWSTTNQRSPRDETWAWHHLHVEFGCGVIRVWDNRQWARPPGGPFSLGPWQFKHETLSIRPRPGLDLGRWFQSRWGYATETSEHTFYVTPPTGRTRFATSDTNLCVPYWAVAVPLFGPAAVGYVRRARRRRRLKSGRCVNCGYDLRGGGARCPECGAEAPPVSLPSAAV